MPRFIIMRKIIILGRWLENCFIFWTYKNYLGSELPNHRALITIAAFVSLISACSQDVSEPEAGAGGEPPLTSKTLGEQTVLSASEYLASTTYISADLQNGASQARICKACHSLQEGGANMIGPGLFGMFGQAAGQQVGFAYSPALREAEFVWTPRALDAWLAQPAQFLPGNRMTFAGIRNQSDRDDLIAYLLTQTADSEP